MSVIQNVPPTGESNAPRSNQLLLVDDDDELREGLAELLEDAGFKVTQAVNGQEALRSLRAGCAPVVILLDLLMPVMNGWQFCHVRRNDAALAGIPVIALSAAASSNPMSPYFIDVDDFLPKPIDVDHLLAKLQALVSSTDEGPSASSAS